LRVTLKQLGIGYSAAFSFSNETRAGKSFSEDEWRAWLAEIADRYRSGMQTRVNKTRKFRRQICRRNSAI
jgi:hypothetical protein